MRIHLKNIAAKFHPDPMWNDGNLDFMNAPKLNPLKRDWSKFMKSVNNKSNTTGARLIV